ncbi:hypothetical protein [Herbiconiux sp. L3-i23]|uniref:PH-like domain-containing protein n=1 Tax=Herbiconiux sp. L3-i23 TaxID=2905871 RepID=UPI00204BC754|nr:hypothetical protein [Herbiconiux sp. L3-i23]BDI22781.1 hypothetical protein L3i23_15570 [Herbiconiux sp. L3-i23]
MPDSPIPLLVIGALVVLAFVGMAIGWRARRRRQSHLDAAVPVPVALSTPILTAEVFYVATTVAERPLDRIAVAGLGVRGRADVAVHPEGVVIAIRGTEPVFLAADAIASAGLGTFAVDRVVEPDGLAVISWTLGDTGVDTYLRASTGTEKTALVGAVQSIVGGSVTSKTASPEGKNQQ